MRIFFFALLLSADLFAADFDHGYKDIDVIEGPVGVACTDFSGLWEGDCYFENGNLPGLPLIYRLRIEQNDCRSVYLGGVSLDFGVPLSRTRRWGDGGTETNHMLVGFHSGDGTRLIENESFVRSRIWAGYVSMEVEHGYSIYSIENGTLLIDGFRVENSFWSGIRADPREISKSCILHPLQP